MGYVHFEIDAAQSAKAGHSACGDVYLTKRDSSSTVIICCDGIGSGMRAHIAATMCSTRLMQLIDDGVSLRNAFSKVVNTMSQWSEPSLPWSAFSVIRILNEGQTTVLNYDFPPAMLVNKHRATVIPQRTHVVGHAVISESFCNLGPGEGVMITSDGVTQAGLGRYYPLGWQTENICKYITSHLEDGCKLNKVPSLVHSEARRLWQKDVGDDCTAVMASCRPGVCINILTGAPADPDNDESVIREFMQMEGLNIVCGATTAKIAARYLNQKLEIAQDYPSLITPPHYNITGIDLVTEGIVTLNQLYNIIEDDPESITDDSGVTQLYLLLGVADRVNFIVGTADNPANSNQSFRQMGLMSRSRIIPMLKKKLQHAGKLVVTKYV